MLAAFGFSINTLTMFGMVLAIGLLVDDAIVVVENVERVMAEEGLPPKEATRKSMGQIQGALVGIAMVLSAVFTDGVLFGAHCHLSSVLHHYRFRDGAVGTGGVNPDAGAVRHDAETHSERRSRARPTPASSAGLTACSRRARTITPTA